MTYDHLIVDAPLSFPGPDARVAPVLFNPNKQQFRLIANPALSEIQALVEEHARFRLDAHWDFLNQLGSPATSATQTIRAFIVHSSNRAWLPAHVLRDTVGATTKVGILSKLAGASIEEQRGRLSAHKPKSIAEMLALYRDQPTEDITGYRYFMSILEDAPDALTFFGKLIDNLFSFLKGVDYRLGTPPTEQHQARAFELLGMAMARQWILFPFIHHSSGLQEHYVLSHRENVGRFFIEPYRPAEISDILAALEAVPVERTTHAKFAIHFRNLVIASTFRDIRQCSSELFEACMAVMAETERPMVSQNIGMARRTYNALIKIHNSKAEKGYLVREVMPRRKNVTVAEFASFQYLRDLDQKWDKWATAFESFVAATEDSQGGSRRLTCTEFAKFLVGHLNPPASPELTPRDLINDYDDEGATYRNHLKAGEATAETRNGRLAFLGSFFDFVRYSSRASSADAVDKAWFPNPVDMRFDRFVVKYKAGSHRKAIGSDIMEMTRNILVADDYEWAKTALPNDWATLVNDDTGVIERVWCPSATILLYTLLSVPLRSLQGRLLDSGEGDAEIFDFDSGRMVPNPHQLPVDGKLDPRRKEGVLQTMASGMRGITDIVGLWISTNKTSDQGYAVPWVSEDLLRHLRYQREFIARYAAHPHTHGISEAQGHRNTPIEWVEREPKFYCLFRDPAAEQKVAASLPVSKQKLLKLWGALCLETQRRYNDGAVNGGRITLVRPGTESERYPKALFDIHSLRVSGITDLLDRGVPLNIVSEYVAGHATYIMTLWYDKPAPGAVRNYLMQARAGVGSGAGPLPDFTQEELADLKPYLLPHPDHRDLYNGFDALDENKGLILLRQSGICPGARCSEGGLDETMRMVPVPVGDRGPSCPQCRFWLTGPAFLLGQAIEGNQLILKIRNKIQNLTALRDRVMDAEDADDTRQADLLRGQAEIEERQLNDMLTEWWHRMRFYEASVAKLETYRAAQRAEPLDGVPGSASPVVLLSKASEADIRFGFNQATSLELKHFLSTCAEILPEFSLEQTGARQDIEIAVGKFLAINNERDLTAAFFKLSDQQRLTAANLAVELMMGALPPESAEALLEGSLDLTMVPGLREDITTMLAHSHNKSFVLTPREPITLGEPA